MASSGQEKDVPSNPTDRISVAPRPAQSKATRPPVKRTPAARPPAQRSSAPRPLIQKPSAPRTPTQKPSAPRPPVQKPSAPKPPVQKPSTPRPPIQKPSAPTPPIQKPSAPTPPVQKPSAPTPPVQKPSAPRPPIQKPSAPRPPVQKPSAPRSPIQKPSAPRPPVQTPSAPILPSRQPESLPKPSLQIRQQWTREQEQMRRHLQTTDSPEVTSMVQSNANTRRQFYVGGVDISFINGDETNACACLAIMAYPQMKLVYSDTVMVRLDAPYIPGYLAYREVPHYSALLRRLDQTKPHLRPSLIMVDGNGTLHPRGFGSACHLGVKEGLATIGIGKTLHRFGSVGQQHDEKLSSLRKPGDVFPIHGRRPDLVLGVALMTPGSEAPIYVSPGNRVSMKTAVALARQCANGRLPAPVYWADQISRRYIEENIYKCRKR